MADFRQVLMIVRLFTLIAVLAAGVLGWQPGEFFDWRVLAGLTALTLMSITAEILAVRRLKVLLPKIVYGTIAGWLAAVLLMAAFGTLPAVAAVLQRPYPSIFKLCVMYLAVAMALRSGGVLNISLSMPSVSHSDGARVEPVRIVFCLIIALFMILYHASPYLGAAPFYALVAAAGLALVVEVFAGERLRAALTVAVPAAFFALALADVLFGLMAASGRLNLYFTLEAQQLILFILGFYWGGMMLTRNRRYTAEANQHTAREETSPPAEA